MILVEKECYRRRRWTTEFEAEADPLHMTPNQLHKSISVRVGSARLPSVTANELKWNTPAASGGGSADLVWKRTN